MPTEEAEKEKADFDKSAYNSNKTIKRLSSYKKPHPNELLIALDRKTTLNQQNYEVFSIFSEILKILQFFQFFHFFQFFNFFNFFNFQNFFKISRIFRIFWK